MDGTSRGRAPGRLPFVPGSHTIRGMGPDGLDANTTRTASGGKSQVVDLDLKRPSARPNGWLRQKALRRLAQPGSGP